MNDPGNRSRAGCCAGAAPGAPGRPRAASRRRAQSRRHAARTTLALYAAVATGSAIGGTLRAIASLLIHAHAAPGFPWGTLFANVTGSFLIGFYATLTGPDGRIFASTRQRQFFMTGICGGYTTFSVFSLETFELFLRDAPGAAALNVGVSLAGWLAAVWLGHRLATVLNRLRRS